MFVTSPSNTPKPHHNERRSTIFWANNGGALYTGRRYEGSIAQYSSSKGTTNRSVIGIDASRSSAFYGASSYVTPTNTSVYMCIRVK